MCSYGETRRIYCSRVAFPPIRASFRQDHQTSVTWSRSRSTMVLQNPARFSTAQSAVARRTVASPRCSLLGLTHNRCLSPSQMSDCYAGPPVDSSSSSRTTTRCPTRLNAEREESTMSQLPHQHRDRASLYALLGLAWAAPDRRSSSRYARGKVWPPPGSASGPSDQPSQPSPGAGAMTTSSDSASGLDPAARPQVLHEGRAPRVVRQHPQGAWRPGRPARDRTSLRRGHTRALRGRTRPARTPPGLVRVRAGMRRIRPHAPSRRTDSSRTRA